MLEISSVAAFCCLLFEKDYKKRLDKNDFLQYNKKVEICGHGGIGRRVRFRILCSFVQVRPLLPAPKREVP